MTTILEEIKQRDASIHQSWFDIYERVLNLDATPDEKVPPPDDAHTALALGDRRWLLARVESLIAVVHCSAMAKAPCPEVFDREDWCDECNALASLTAPVSSHSEKQS